MPYKGIVEQGWKKAFIPFFSYNNNNGFAHLEASYDFIREIHGKIVSSHVHLCKPDKRIYELLLDKYDLKASECIFFDDNLANVLAAEELGIQAILFTDIKEAVNILESVG